MSYKSQAFLLLKTNGKTMTVDEVTAALWALDPSQKTIGRALRRLTQQGCLKREPKDPTKPNGIKVFTALPNAVFPTRTKSTKSPPPTMSSGKAFAMTLPANKPTFITATIQALQELVDAKKTFSAHDVTRHLRDLVKDDKVKIDPTETGTVFAYGKTIPKIVHEDVKALVHEYFLTGKMDGYDRLLKQDHWEYGPSVVPAIPTASNVSAVAAVDYNGDPTL